MSEATLTKLRSHLSTLRNRAGQAIVLGRDVLDVPVAKTPPGRLVVAPGQAVEATEWGQVTYDQTCMTFSSAGQRSSQWPSPHDGAHSYLMDQLTYQVYENGVWRTPPTGYVASFKGPASAMDANGTVMSFTATLPRGPARRYMVEAQVMCTFTMTTNNYTCFAQLFVGTNPIPYLFYNTFANPVSGAGLCGYAFVVTGPTTGSLSGHIYCPCTIPPLTAAHFAVNSCTITVTDLGV